FLVEHQQGAAEADDVEQRPGEQPDRRMGRKRALHGRGFGRDGHWTTPLSSTGSTGTQQANSVATCARRVRCIKSAKTSTDHTIGTENSAMTLALASLQPSRPPSPRSASPRPTETANPATTVSRNVTVRRPM